MVAECALLGVSAVVAKDAFGIEYLKSKQRELDENEKAEFNKDKNRRFIHFTSEESAKKIMESGFLIPTKGVINNHFSKTMDDHGNVKNAEMVYMFDSNTFNVDDYIRNLPKNRSPFGGCYEYYAISTRPNKYALNDFKKRAQDGAITYNGRLDIDGTDTRLVKYALMLDEQGEYTLEEMGMNEEYTPSPELLAKLEKDKVGMLRYTARTYMSEIRKSRESMKRLRLERAEYKEQLRRKKEFIKANKQFIREERDKSYIYEQDGRTIVVKNVEFEEVGGKKLQRIAIMEKEASKGKKGKESMTFCYMDEADISQFEPDVAAKYFFTNHDEARRGKETTPRYIGLPLKILETGEVVNEYDIGVDAEFKAYMDKRQESKARLDKKYADMKKSKSILGRIKAAFRKVFNREEEPPMLTPAEEERQKLAALGYSSVEAMNADDKEAEMFKHLEEGTYPPSQVASYDLTQGEQMTRETGAIEVEEK